METDKQLFCLTTGFPADLGAQTVPFCFLTDCYKTHRATLHALKVFNYEAGILLNMGTRHIFVICILLAVIFLPGEQWWKLSTSPRSSRLCRRALSPGNVTPAVTRGPNFKPFPITGIIWGWDGWAELYYEPLSITSESAKGKAVKWCELTPLASAGHVSLNLLPQKAEHKNHQSRQSYWQRCAGNCPKTVHSSYMKATTNCRSWSNVILLQCFISSSIPRWHLLTRIHPQNRNMLRTVSRTH